MNKPTRVAVVGVGYLGKIHAKIYAAMENVELVAVVDTDQAAARQAAQEYGCDGLFRASALAGKIDAVARQPDSCTLSRASSYVPGSG